MLCSLWSGHGDLVSGKLTAPNKVLSRVGSNELGINKWQVKNICNDDRSGSWTSSLYQKGTGN